MSYPVRIVLWGFLFTVLSQNAHAQSPLTCSGIAAAPTVRSHGAAERIGELVINCTGGAPTPAGQTVPQLNLTLTLNTAVTSRQFAQGWSEALLLIDDPPPSAQLACATPDGICPVTGTGTGTGTYNGTAGRPNIFQGRQTAANAVTWTGVPLDPPGQGSRRLRFVNLRANAAQLGADASVQAVLTASSSPLSFSGTLANVEDSVVVSVKNETASAGQLSGFTLEFSEVFAAVFKTRTAQGAALASQNVPGAIPPGVESGFVNQQLPATSRGDLSLAGLADSGLRVRIRLSGVPAQAVVSAPLAVDFGNGGRLQLAATDANGAGAFTPAASSTLPNTNGTVTAVYEFTAASATALETVNIPISIAYSSPPPSPLQRLSGDISLAPLSPNNVPRFVNQIRFEAAVPAALNITTTSLPGAAAGASYTQQIQAAGGTPPYTFSRDTALPPGLSLSPQGVLSGTPSAPGTYNFTVRVTDSVGASAAREFSLTVSGAGGAVVLSAAQIEIDAIAGGGRPPLRRVSVLAAGAAPVDFRVVVDGGPGAPSPGWIMVLPLSGSTPGNLTIGVDPAGLAVGTYTARIRVLAGASEQIVMVILRVAAAPPKLEAAPGLITGAARVNDPQVLREFLHLRNAGGGDPIPFSIEVAAGGSWITRVETAAGLARAQPSTAVGIEIDTTGLKAGFYRDELRVTWSGGVLRVPVVLFVAPPEPVMDLNHTGLRFMTRSGQRSSVIKTFKVLNRDPLSTLNWSAEVVRGDDWLILLPARGTAAVGSPGLVRVALKPSVANLAPGARFGLIRVSSPTALTSPLYVVVVLYVVPDQTAARLDFDSAGAVLISTPGAQRPVTRDFQVGANSTTPIEFQASAATNEGGEWLSVNPASGTVSADDNGGEGIRITVSASSARLVRGIYTGEVVLASQGIVSSLAITFIVADSATQAAPAGARAAGCTPARLAVTPTGPFNNFSVPAGWPEALSVDLRDDCGQPVQGASVIASFSNGDPPLMLRADGDSGTYSADWQPGHPADQMDIVIRARSGTFAEATAALFGQVAPNTTPTLARNGTIHNLDPKLGGPLSPGVVAQVYGTGLAATSESTGAVPLTTRFKTTQVLVGPYEAPLYYVSPGQLVVQLPNELAPNRQYPLIAAYGDALTLPDTINIVPVQPGVAAFSDGRLIAQHADFTLVDEQRPARRGEVLTMYLVGMGATNPAVPSGAPSPADPLARPVEPATVTVDGQTANIVFAGLTPFGVGLYQINFRVPPDARLNQPLEVVVTQGGVRANRTTLTVVP